MAEQLGKQALNTEEEQKKIKEIEARIASINKEREEKLVKAATTITEKPAIEEKIKKITEEYDSQIQSHVKELNQLYEKELVNLKLRVTEMFNSINFESEFDDFSDTSSSSGSSDEDASSDDDLGSGAVTSLAGRRRRKELRRAQRKRAQAAAQTAGGAASTTATTTSSTSSSSSATPATGDKKKKE